MLRRHIIPVYLFLILSLMITGCTAQQQNQTSTPSSQAAPPSNTPVSSPSESPSAAPTPETQQPTPSETPQVTLSAPSDQQENAGSEKIKVKAVYISGYVASARLDHFIELVDKTELNALVIDIKEAGTVNYKSEVPLVKELGLYQNIYDAREVLQKCHDHNIRVIGRIVTFRDKGLATKKPEYAIKKPSGAAWQEGSQGPWTNPYLDEVQQYNIDIAKEAVELGFDEIQFDYVRFPTAKKNEVSYGADVPEKIDAISAFVTRAASEIKKVKPVPVSADVFGIIAESVTDGKSIGQHLELVGLNLDYISPMVYPSHYANAGKGVMGNGVGQQINGVMFTAPDLQPYDVVYQSLLKLKSRVSVVEGYKADVRPYLQDFTADYINNKSYYQVYGVKQVQEQIKAVYDAGYSEWILWNGKNIYTEDALLPQD